MDKVVSSSAQAIKGIGDGASLAVGGFGLWHTDRVRLRDPRRGASAASRPTPTIVASTTGPRGSCFRDRDSADHRVLCRRETRSSLASTSPARSRSSSLPRAPLPSDWRGRVRHTGVLHPPPGWATQIAEGFSVEVCRWRHDRGGLPFQGDSRGRVDKEPRTFVLEAIVADFGLSGQPRVTVTATWPSTSRPATSTSLRRWLAK